MARTVRSRMLSLLAVALVIALCTVAFWSYDFSATSASVLTDGYDGKASHGKGDHKGHGKAYGKGYDKGYHGYDDDYDDGYSGYGSNQHRLSKGEGLKASGTTYSQAVPNYGSLTAQVYGGQAAAEGTPAPIEETMAAAASTPEPAEEALLYEEEVSVYVVQRGDTFPQIASRLGVSVGALLKANGLTGYERLREGQELIIPEKPSGGAPGPAEEPGPAATLEPQEEEAAPPTPEAAEEVTPEATEEPLEEATTEAAIPEETVIPEETATPEEEATEEAGPAPTVEPSEEMTPTEEVEETGVLTETEAATETEEVTGPEAGTESGEMTGAEGITDTEEITEAEEITVPEVFTETEVAPTEEMTGTEETAPSEEISPTEPMTGTQGATDIITPVVIVPAPANGLHVQGAPAEVWRAPTQSVEVYSPVAGGAYHSPIKVTGLSSTFAGTVSVTLLDADGAVLAERITMGGAAGDYAFFHTELRFSVTEPTAAVLNVVDMDMADGTVMTEIHRPLVLLPGQRTVDITYPQVGATLCGDLLAAGYSNTFEANVVLELRERGGDLLAQVPTMGGTLGVYRDFAHPFTDLDVDTPVAALLSMNETDASDRYLHIDKTVIPFTLYPVGSAECTAAG